MKKRKLIYPIAFGLISALIIGGYFGYSIQQTDLKRGELWISKRPLPENIAINSYLVGNAARLNQDLDKAVTAYANVLKKDPHNNELLETAYLLAMIQGKPEVILPYLGELKTSKMMADYTRLVGYIKENQLSQALEILKNKPQSPGDELLLPMVKAWIYAAQNNQDKAIQEIDVLKDFPFIKGYQKVLLGSYFKNDKLIQTGINQMGDHTISAIGYFPLVKEHITKTGNWEKSAFNKKYQELIKTYPVTADLLIQIGQKDITLTKGLAETFYVTSALGGNGHFSREESMAANSLALLLDPKKQISFIWGAELAEDLNLPNVALSYYDRLPFHSATIDFKHAASLMLANKTKEAITIMERLEPTNKTSIPLLTLLAQAYQDQGFHDKALGIYNRLIPLLERRTKNEPLIQAYLARSLIYGPDKNDEMLMDLKRAHALNPENTMLLNDLGYNLLENNQMEGFQLVQRAYQKKPQDPSILDSMAFGYWKKGQFSVALPLAERALDLMPQSALITAHLGKIYEDLGRHREARFQFKKALDLKTDLPPDLTKELTQKLQKQGE